MLNSRTAVSRNRGRRVETRRLGKPLDREAGLNLYWYGARFYDPKLGRFLALDPASSKYPGLSLYAYCANNPLKNVDPDGGNFGAFIEGMLTGEWEAAKQAIQGLREMVSDPIGTATQVGDAIIHPVRTASAIGSAILTSWQSGDFGKGRVVGRIGGELTLALAGSKGIGMLKTPGAAAKAGVTANRAAGLMAESAVGVLGQGRRVPSLSGTAAYRVADQLTPTTLTEVKNVGRLSLTNQLSDFVSYSQSTNRAFMLYTRPTTQISKPLQNLIDAGTIIHKPIPGM